MTIGKKLYAGFGAILAILLVLFAANIITRSHEATTMATTAKLNELLRATESVRVQIVENHLNLRGYVLTGAPADLEAYRAGVADFRKRVESALALAATGEQQRSLQQIQSEHLRWTEEAVRNLIDKRKQVDAGESTVDQFHLAYLTSDPDLWLEKSIAPFKDLQQAINQDLAAAQASDELAAGVSTAVFVVGTLLGIGLGIGIAFYTARSISQPLQQLMSVAREIGDNGDLSQDVDISRDDELGQLARNFRNMVTYLREMATLSEQIASGDLTVQVAPRSERDTLGRAFADMTHGLRELVSSVRDNASQVASGSTQVAGASEESAKIAVQTSSAIDEVTSTMHEMSVNVQNMVKNTQTQASSVSETSASIDQMVASIQRVADTAKVLLDISQRSREEVQNGIVTMEKTTAGLTRINQSIQSSGQIIDVLGQRADDIGKIVEVIDDLAEQTNLLALNAAIEAARAGEHGLGFAVVADEVRKLAEKSAQSTREIADLIQSIQKEARKAVENMEKSTTIVDEGLGFGGEMNVALRKISNVVTEVYKFAQEIGAATNEQSHGSSQIAKSTSRLNEITHEITSAVEEQASGAQAVVRAMERMRELVQHSTSGSTELAASAEQMSRMSRIMLDAMDRFALSDGNGNGHAGNGHRPAGPVREASYARPAYAGSRN